MPMGLSNSPATFQRMMELVLRGLPWHICMVYLDDILIYSGTFEEHLTHLKEVFSRIKSAGLKLNPGKCHLARDHVVFLGHVVSEKGLQPDPRNTEKDFSKHAAPLNQLVGKNVPFVWSTDCDNSFNYLKGILSSAPIVTMPEFKVPFKVYTDASKWAVGAVLAQEKEGRECVVAYASRALNATQRRWSTFDRELWAIVWAVREFRHYLGLSSFTIITDHRPLLALRRMSIEDDPTGRRARWLLELDPLNWVIEHKKGNQHKNADALSRRPVTPDMKDVETVVKEVRDVNVVSAEQSNNNISCSATAEVAEEGTVTNSSFTADTVMSLSELSCDAADIVAMQQNDPDINTVRQWVERSQRPPRRQLTGEPVAQVVVPPGLKHDILMQLHGAPTAAHFSAERVWERARRFCYWPSMFKDIKDWCEQCTACQTRRRPVPIHKALMGGSLAMRPFERVAMDILELPITTKGN
ncbi:hypothetical protein F2P79_026035, partial [Pimephales promelas]